MSISYLRLDSAIALMTSNAMALPASHDDPEHLLSPSIPDHHNKPRHRANNTTIEFDMRQERK